MQDFSFSSPGVISVSELNDRVARCLQVNFAPLWVAGEIRGFTRAASGHWYFTLKDRASEVSCAMFAGDNRRVRFMPKTGDRVQVHGQVSIYRPRGSYQLVVDAMQPAGLGELYERFLMLKNKLQAEGLFDPARKKAIARVNFRIGVVTSLKAAALRDVITTLRRRAPYAVVTVFPASVQGEAAVGELTASLKAADAARQDVILLVRGGGSLQDLWAFNEEAVARTLVAMQTPVIVGVGHESDVTIADWAADFRAATPTAAAEHASENISVLLTELALQQRLLKQNTKERLQGYSQRLDWLTASLVTPQEKLERNRESLLGVSRELLQVWQERYCQRPGQDLASLKQSLSHGMQRELLLSLNRFQSAKAGLQNPREGIQGKRAALEATSALLRSATRAKLQTLSQRRESLDALLFESSPQAILTKGYAYVSDEAGALLKSSRRVKPCDPVTIHWFDGEAFGKIIEVRPKNK